MKDFKFNQLFGGGGTLGPTCRWIRDVRLCRNFSGGFTLAEVLITLGIIGVVAAMTMPSLIANYQKKVWVTQLKKEISVINNNLIRLKADEGNDNLNNSPIVISNKNGALIIDANKYKEYFGLSNAPKNSKMQKLLNMFDVSDDILATNDGAYLAFSDELVFLDINADKGPNRGGIDRFLFYITNNGVEHMALDTEDNRKLCVDMVNVKSDPDYSKDEFDALQFSPYGAANFCFTKIMHDGWEMNY